MSGYDEVCCFETISGGIVDIYVYYYVKHDVELSIVDAQILQPRSTFVGFNPRI
jgi:hypothetical protein